MFEELQLITKVHFGALEKLVQEQGLPILNQQRSRSQSGNVPGRSRTSSYNHPTSSGYASMPQQVQSLRHQQQQQQNYVQNRAMF